MKYLNRIIEYGLYLLVFLLPIQTRLVIRAGELSEYGTISLYGTDILLLVLLVLFVIYKLQITSTKFQTNSKSQAPNSKQTPNSKFQIQNYWWVIAALELFIFISIFFAQDKILAVYRYGVFLLGVGLFWLIVRASYSKVKLIFSLLAGILVQAILGIWQFLTQSGFSINYLGMAVHKAEELGTSVIETIGADGLGERWIRAYGGLPHPNILGGVLAVGLLLVILQIIKNPKSQAPNSKQISNFKFQISNFLILFTVYCLLFTSLFFTFSRAAWLALLVGLITMFVLLILKKDLFGQKKFLEFVLAGAVLVFLLFNIYGDLVKTRVAADARLEVKSNTERIESYKMAREVIKDNWLFGVGLGNYTLRLREEAKLPIGSLASEYQPAHNVFLLIRAEIGVFGLLFFIVFLLFTFYFLLKNLKDKNNFVSYKIALITALIVIATFDHWLWSLHFGVLFFWLVMGLILKREESVVD